jgi:hypothetical protein
MDVGSLEQLKRVWNNPTVPVLYGRGPGNPLLGRLPYASTNRSWLQESGRKKPVWIASKKHWELPQAWFSDLVKRHHPATPRSGKVCASLLECRG